MPDNGSGEDGLNGDRVFHVRGLPPATIFELESMKARLHCDDWRQFLQTLADHSEAIVATIKTT